MSKTSRLFLLNISLNVVICGMRCHLIFLTLLGVLFIHRNGQAQSDTAQYDNGRSIPYLVAGHHGKQLPSYFVTATWNGLNGTYFTEKHGLFSFGTSYMFAQLKHFTYWADGMIFLFESTRNKQSGKLQIDEEVTGYNTATIYTMKMDGLIRTFDFGLHLGVDQTKYRGFLEPPFPVGADEYFRAYLTSVMGYEFGIGGATRRGLSLSTSEGTRYRFFVCKFSLDAVYYQATRLEVNGVDYMLGQGAIDGTWTYDQFKYNKWGGKAMVDFYWSKTSRELPRNNPHKIFATLHFRLGVQILPKREYSSAVIFSCLGIGFAIKPRFYLHDMSSTQGLKPIYQVRSK